MPSFNQAAFLEQGIRSVLLQDYPSLELVVIDGGSDDGSIEILERYAPFLHHWESEPDRGQAHAINKGFGHATGAILAWLNSDDLYLPGAVPHMAGLFQRHPGAGIVHAACEFIDEEGASRGTHQPRPLSLAELARKNVMGQPGVFFRRSAWESAGPLDESLQYRMDHDLWLRMRLAGEEVVRDERVVAQYRLHGASKTVHRKAGFYHESFTVLDRLFARTPRPGISPDEAYAHAVWRTLYENWRRDATGEGVAILKEIAPDAGDAADRLGRFVGMTLTRTRLRRRSLDDGVDAARATLRAIRRSRDLPVSERWERWAAAYLLLQAVNRNMRTLRGPVTAMEWRRRRRNCRRMLGRALKLAPSHAARKKTLRLMAELLLGPGRLDRLRGRD